MDLSSPTTDGTQRASSYCSSFSRASRGRVASADVTTVKVSSVASLANVVGIIDISKIQFITTKYRKDSPGNVNETIDRR